jgi:hypothetical protein
MKQFYTSNQFYIYKENLNYDLLTVSRILNERVKNLSIPTTFIKDVILKIFDDELNKYYMRNDLYQPELFAYLFIHMKVMNLYYKHQMVYLNVNNTQTLKEDVLSVFKPYIDIIDEMIFAIRKYIIANM